MYVLHLINVFYHFRFAKPLFPYAKHSPLPFLSPGHSFKLYINSNSLFATPKHPFISHIFLTEVVSKKKLGGNIKGSVFLIKDKH